MITSEYIWLNGEMVKWENATTHVLTHTLHYGAGAFEGIRAYQTDRGPAVFRLPEHIDRLYYSSAAVGINIPFQNSELVQATTSLIAMNKLEHCYIRPIAYYGYGVMGLNPRDSKVDTAIVCWPWGRYLPHDMVDLKISQYIRIHPKSLIADAKVCGHYVNSILSVLEIRGTKYHEALLLDYNGNVAEGPGENFFMVKDQVLYTPKLGTILKGITRDTIITLARDSGHTVVERDITPEEALKADEAFYTGTAAEVTPIRSIDDNVIGGGKIGPVTELLKDTYQRVVLGKEKRYEEFLTYVK